ELGAGMADEDRAGDQLVARPARAIAEAPLPHVREIEPAVPLDERRDVRPGVAAVVDHGERVALPERGGGHDPLDLAARRGWSNRPRSPEAAPSTTPRRARARASNTSSRPFG